MGSRSQPSSCRGRESFCNLRLHTVLAKCAPALGKNERGDDILNEGFLGTAAPFVADLVLLLEIAMGAGLLIGAWLAHKQRFRQHAWCQSVIVLLNFAVITMMMAPSFRIHVLPRIPARLDKAYSALATAHAALGTVTELAGLYILLSAGTR